MPNVFVISMPMTRTLVLNNRQVQQRIDRLAWQLYEHCYQEKEVLLAGIAPHGYHLAERIARKLEEISPIRTSIIQLKLDKDHPTGTPAQLDTDTKALEGKVVIVVDDVSNSGRTLIYGVKPFLTFPVKSILTLVLVDRDHNRFPVKTNFVGLSLATTLQEHITVELSEDGNDAVFLD